MDEELLARLTSVYRDLHRHPELSSQEHRTADIVAAWMRADMDALPVAEETGLPYASTVAGVMRACGDDVHVTCLLGAATTLDAVRDSWRGTLAGRPSRRPTRSRSALDVIGRVMRAESDASAARRFAPGRWACSPRQASCAAGSSSPCFSSAAAGRSQSRSRDTPTRQRDPGRLSPPRLL